MKDIAQQVREICSSCGYAHCHTCEVRVKRQGRIFIVDGLTEKVLGVIKRKRGAVMANIVFAFLVMSLFLVGVVRAEAVQAPANLWKGLIAEATSDGYDGMYAVACCVRNRLQKGMNNGLCGLKRKNLDAFVKSEGSKREQQAKQIVLLVFTMNSADVTKGATNFECIERYGTPKWARKMKVVAKIGEHTFYK